MNANEPSKPPARNEKVPARSASRLSQVARRSWYYGLVALILTYAGNEVLERVWLPDLGNQGVLHLFHIATGILLFLGAASVVGWMIIKASPAFLAVSPVEEESSGRARLTEEEQARIYAQWFITMRWIAVLVAVFLVIITVEVVEFLPRAVWRPLMVTVGVLAGLNVLYGFLISWDRGARILLLLQGYIDLLLLTVLLHFSGGVENPLSTVMIFHVIIGGILLSRRQCYGIAAAGSLLFGLLVWAEGTGVLEHYTLAVFPHFEQHGHVSHAAHQPFYAITAVILQTAILFLTGYFVTTLAERIRYNERRLEAMADRALADRQLLEQALDTTGTGLRVLNRNFQSSWANNRWIEWFVGPPGTTGQGFELLNGENSPARQSLQDGRTRVTEVPLEAGGCPAGTPSPGGGLRVFQVTTAPLLDGSQNISQVVELAQDITQQKQTQAQMMRAGKLAAVGELAGQVAHEVNNPISIISAKANLLLSDHRQEMSPKIALELGKINHLANRVARIAQGLLSYCRPSPATRIALDIRVSIRKSLAMIEEHAKTRGVRIEEDLPGCLPAVQANAHELEQVFLNLFLNALDAMPQGGWLKVSAHPGSVRFADGKSGLAVTVEDTGDGIPEAIRERVFEPFFTTKQEGRGTGLGLSICLGLVRSHGGELQIDSKVWQGTRVTVKLPIDTPVAQQEAAHG